MAKKKKRSEGVKRGLRNILFPSVLAGITIFAIATIWNLMEYGIIFACFGSSAFIIYVYPRSEQASLHNILGSYPLAGFFGYATIHYLLPLLSFDDTLRYAIAGGFAVGITTLAMLLTGFKHGPAAGAALAFVLRPADVGAVFFLIGGGITLLVFAKILTFMVKEEHALEEAIKHAFKINKKDESRNQSLSKKEVSRIL
ncbi:MAG TPA: HPP family protein [Candidatus Altiarchaeales archaeon]|nr:HPP family protein [Candidatus Altiarchaeales archaeon]